MKTRFSTTEVHPRDRFDAWHSFACQVGVAHDSIPESRSTFQAQLRWGTLADIGLALIDLSPMIVARGARHVVRANTEEVLVCQQITGRSALELDGHETFLEPGDIRLLDPRLPFDTKYFAGSRLLVLQIPRSLLEVRLGKTRDMTALCMKPSEGDNGLTSAFLALLPIHAGRLGRVAEEIVRDQTLDLLALSLANATGTRRPRLSSARSLVRMKLRAAIEARLTNPDLAPETVAAAAGVSVRYANAVLADESTSIMRLIQARRLARCRRALEDPPQSHRMVSEIAYGWGFSDMAHFGRKFRAVYGSLPSEHRRIAIATR